MKKNDNDRKKRIERNKCAKKNEKQHNKKNYRFAINLKII